MDTVSNLLTTIRNAELASHKEVTLQATKLNLAILNILIERGVVRNLKSNEESKPATCQVDLIEGKRHNFKRVSKPGRRYYVGVDEIPTVRQGRGFAIVSTPAGVMTGRDAKKQGIGGELLCTIY